MAKATITRQSMVQQLHDMLLDMLRDEQYKAGSTIPSEMELAERFHVSRATIREALKGLVQEGLLDCRHGIGYFVLSREAVIHRPITQWQSVTDLMADMGYTVENRVLRVREESPPPHVRRALQLEEGQTVVQLERVRISRDEPLIYSIDIFPRAFISGLLQEQDWSGSLMSLFDERWHAHIVSSRAKISAVTLSPQVCVEIGVPAQTAWLCMEQLNVTKDGRPVLFSRDYHKGENFEFYVTRRRS
ncbi:MAG TPA: GntR family transcriptional regulator [Ktedonobacteraceae bacterium]|nr:GntR family transcriptional regulator [Ktedonobacteraceae bacterium]